MENSWFHKPFSSVKLCQYFLCIRKNVPNFLFVSFWFTLNVDFWNEFFHYIVSSELKIHLKVPETIPVLLYRFILNLFCTSLSLCVHKIFELKKSLALLEFKFSNIIDLTKTNTERECVCRQYTHVMYFVWIILCMWRREERGRLLRIYGINMIHEKEMLNRII